MNGFFLDSFRLDILMKRYTESINTLFISGFNLNIVVVQNSALYTYFIVVGFMIQEKMVHQDQGI
ncbi:hypothetical protein BLOT_006703 [Blomia tropicalis]|nr:hypothetical protein BLOT_006703 [Blomia tropicalis]